MAKKGNILLIEGRDAPLIPIRFSEEDGELFACRHRHWLTELDAQRVGDLSVFLVQRGITPYLSGSVTEQWIYHGDHQYHDVDILGVVNNKSFKEGKPKTAINNLEVASRTSGIIIGESAFKVQLPEDFPMKSYMNLYRTPIGARFILTPLKSVREFEENPHEGPKKIDLVFYSLSSLKKAGIKF